MNRRTILIFIALVTALSLPVAFADSSKAELHFSMQNYAGSFNERCLTLQRNDELVLTVTSPHPVRMNVHHHTDTTTIFLLNMLVENARPNTATASDSGEYCIELTNEENRPDAYSVDLQYEIASN